MPIKKAVAAFREERLNCAQSVLRGFQHIKEIPEERIAAAQSLGSGRAEEGLCGALYAALELSEEGKKPTLRRLFAEKAGAEHCREIRKKRQLPCVGCVEVAARLLIETGEARLDENK
jgi:hypothetical protein